MGLTPRARRQGHGFRAGDHALADLPDRRVRRRLCAGGPAHLRQSQRRGKSQGPAGARRPVDHRADLPAVPAARGAQAQPRPSALRRRTGDAVDRPRAAAQSAAADSRRALARAGAADRARGVSHRPADEGRGHFGAAGRTERAHESRNRRRRLCAGRRHRGLFRHRARSRRRRSPGPGTGRRQRRGMDADVERQS